MLSALQMVVEMLGGWPAWQSFGDASWRALGLFCLLMAAMMSLVGLLAIWAGLGRGRWFLRAAVVLGCISLLMLIPAFELVIVYVLQAGLTIVVLGLWQNWRLARRATAASEGSTPDAGPRSPWQFSILDLLLLMAFVAWLCAMLDRAPTAVWTKWPGLLVEGATTAGLTVAAAWIALSNGRWWLRLPLLLVLFPAAIMAAWLCLWRRVLRSHGGSLWESCNTRFFQIVLLVASVAILAPVVVVCWWLAHPRTFQEPTRPSPNGYDELVRAGNLIKAVNPPTFETATQAQLKSYVAQCRAVYAPVRAALGKPCQVPVRLNNEGFMKSFGEVGSLMAVGRALYGQGRLAAMEGRKNDAIKSHTDTIRLGRAGMQGGFIIDMLVGITLEGMGRAGIAKMRKSLSAEACLALLPRLKELLDRPALSADVLARDATWDHNAYGWQWRLFSMIDELTGGPLDSTGKAVAFASDRELAQSRLLLCELAVRAYSLQHGRSPATLADLVPSYLPNVPKDPFDGGDFVYRLTPSGYELHSREVGINGQPISVDNPG
jgi:hypothetical protein